MMRSITARCVRECLEHRIGTMRGQLIDTESRRSPAPIARAADSFAGT